MDRQLCKTDNSVKRTPRVGPIHSLFYSFYFILYKTDISLTWHLGPTPKVSVTQ